MAQWQIVVEAAGRQMLPYVFPQNGGGGARQTRLSSNSITSRQSSHVPPTGITMLPYMSVVKSTAHHG